MFLRGRRFYFRRAVPISLIDALGKREIWRSLKTDSYAIAVRRLPTAAAEIEQSFERVRKAKGLESDTTILAGPCEPRAAHVWVDSTSMRSLTLNEAYDRYLADPTRSWSSSTREAYSTCRDLAISIFGRSRELSTITRTDCRDFLDVLRFLPVNARKRFPNLTPREASERAKRERLRTISAANTNSIVSNLSSFLNWATTEELIARNPAKGLRLPDDVAKWEKRFPFDPEQLRAIFNAPLYRGCVNDGRGYSLIGTLHPRGARFWVPLIALHSGARLGEICQLDVSDIRTVDGVDCIVISSRSEIGSTDKRLKTRISERVIPIHRNLAECGLVKFAESRAASGAIKLFDEIERGSDGNRAVAFSKWFTQFLRSCGAKKPRTSFHSFRHNFRDELRSAHIEHDITMLLGGWTRGSTGAVSENYGNGYRVTALDEAIQKLQFDQVDISHLTRCAR